MMNFLVAYDGSKASENALELAKQHAHAFKAKIHVLSITPYNPKAGAEGYEAIITTLEQIKNSFLSEGIECETNLITGTLATGEELVRFAGERAIDKIIIGIRKRSKVGKMLMGSASQHVILEASCPVLVVK